MFLVTQAGDEAPRAQTAAVLSECDARPPIGKASTEDNEGYENSAVTSSVLCEQRFPVDEDFLSTFKSVNKRIFRSVLFRNHNDNWQKSCRSGKNNRSHNKIERE